MILQLHVIRKYFLYGIVTLAVVWVAFLIGTSGKKPTDEVDTIGISAKLGKTALAMIERNKEVLKLNVGSSTLAATVATWQKYEDEKQGFSIQYPADLVNTRHEKSSLIEEGGIFFERLIAYETVDQCNTGKERILLTHVPDFELGLSVRAGTIGEALIEVGGYSKEEVVAILLDSPNFYSDRGVVSELNIGPFSAYHQFFTYDGCGATIFFVPLNHERTLVVEEPIPLGSLGVLENVPKAFQEAQFHYPPIDREKLIYQILSTFRLLEQ